MINDYICNIILTNDGRTVLNVNIMKLYLSSTANCDCLTQFAESFGIVVNDENKYSLSLTNVFKIFGSHVNVLDHLFTKFEVEKLP